MNTQQANFAEASDAVEAEQIAYELACGHLVDPNADWDSPEDDAHWNAREEIRKGFRLDELIANRCALRDELIDWSFEHARTLTSDPIKLALLENLRKTKSVARRETMAELAMKLRVSS